MHNISDQPSIRSMLPVKTVSLPSAVCTVEFVKLHMPSHAGLNLPSDVALFYVEAFWVNALAEVTSHCTQGS